MAKFQAIVLYQHLSVLDRNGDVSICNRVSHFANQETEVRTSALYDSIVIRAYTWSVDTTEDKTRQGRKNEESMYRWV